jgi:hypothetical protein
MKKLLVLIICSIFVLGVSAVNQKNEKIPAAAKSGFAAKFPTIQKVKWSVEKLGEFEAEFVLNGAETSVLYDSKGTLLETEVEIKQNELPEAIKDALAKDFKSYKIDEIEKVIDQMGIVTFELEAFKGKDKIEISFDANGKMMKKEAVKEEKEN